MGFRNEFAPLKETAQRDNWVANSTVVVFKTLVVGALAAFLVPYILNSILTHADMIPTAGWFPGFLIGAAIANWDRLGRMWIVVALASVCYVINLEMVSAVQFAFDNLLAGALE